MLLAATIAATDDASSRSAAYCASIGFSSKALRNSSLPLSGAGRTLVCVSELSSPSGAGVGVPDSLSPSGAGVASASAPSGAGVTSGAAVTSGAGVGSAAGDVCAQAGRL